MSALFSESFVHAVSRLRIAVRQVPRGGRHAEHRSRDLGGGIEFRDFRPYVAGDDVRRIDWNLYRRSGRIFLRLFEETQDLPVYILLDVSDSMFFEAPPRADAARQIAAVLAAVSLNQLDRAAVHPFGADLVPPLAATAGPGALRRVLAYLERLGPAGPTDLPRCLRRFAALRLRGGLAVVVSDFFDPRGVEAVVEAMRSLRHRLVVVPIVRPTDADPAFGGELRLIDCESDARVDVTVTPAGLERYRAAYRAFFDALQAFVARRRATMFALDADQPVLDQLGGLFAGGVLATRE